MIKFKLNRLIKLNASQRRLTEKLAKVQANEKRKTQRGMTLLEIIIVLGIIGTIAAGVVILAQRAFDSKKLSDLTTNVNTIRAAMKDVFGAEGVYPAANSGATLGLTTTNLETTTSLAAPINKLIAMGKLSPQEAINPYSGDFINVGGANLAAAAATTGGTATGANKGYFIGINGLDQKQCRGLLGQTINNWDYVEVVNNTPSKSYGADKTIDLSAAASGVKEATGSTDSSTTTATTPAEINGATGIYRSTALNRSVAISSLTTACSSGSGNMVILGSR